MGEGSGGDAESTHYTLTGKTGKRLTTHSRLEATVIPKLTHRDATY